MIPYTGSRLATILAVCALVRASPLIKREWAIPVNTTPSSTSRKISRGWNTVSCKSRKGIKKGRRKRVAKES